LIIISKVKGFTLGQMRENTMDHGKTTRWKEKEYSPGKTAEFILVPTSTTKKEGYGEFIWPDKRTYKG